MICVLSLAPPAVSPDGGFFNLPLAHAQCCFAANTNILMADGVERPIAGIRPGDPVIGRAGGVNRVTGMHIVPLGRRSLFGINQQRPFFTAKHPFLTPGGGRALDRVATRLETPGLEVTELAAGDVLITAAAGSGGYAGEQIAANTTSVEQGATGGSGTTGAEPTEDGDASSTESTGAEFSGSSTPAGPDLSTSEEQDLISGGWN